MIYDLESGLQRSFERHGAYEMFQELKLVFHTHAHVKRYETFDKYFAYKMVGVNLLDKIVIDRFSSHYHQVTRTS